MSNEQWDDSEAELYSGPFGIALGLSGSDHCRSSAVVFLGTEPGAWPGLASSKSSL